MRKLLKNITGFVGSILTLAVILYPITLTSQKESTTKILPYEFGGLPKPFQTRLIDKDGDGIPDRTLLYSIGPGFFSGQERKPTQREITWYMEN